MAFTEESFYTILKQGVPAKNGTLLRGDKYIFGYWSPSPNYWDGYVSGTFTPVLALGNYVSSYYANSFHITIFEPKYVYNDGEPGYPNGVAKVTFDKEANSYSARINYRDANDNWVTDTGIAFDGAAINPACQWVEGVPVPDFDVYLVLSCQTDTSESTFDVCWGLCAFISDSGKAKYDGVDPWKMVKDMGSSSGYTADLFDKWLNGNYWDPVGNAGRPDPNPGGSDGGGGDWRRPSDVVDVPNLPSLSAASAGFMRIYAISDANLNALASELWTPGFFSSIIKNYASPFDNIISLGIVPYTGLVGTTEAVQIGNYTCNTTADKLSTTMYQIDCGNRDILSFYDNWLDYDGFTDMDVFLPMCGWVKVSPSEFIGGVMNIQYNFDVFSGACIAFIKMIKDGVTGILYTKEGSIRSEVPISGADYARYYSTMLSGALSGGMGMASGNPVQTANGIIQSMYAKPNYQRSGSSGGAQNLLGIRTPYIVYHTPDAIQPSNYAELHGFMSDKYTTIGNCTGFIRTFIDFDDLEGIPCTDQERDMIKKALAEGVYI